MAEGSRWHRALEIFDEVAERPLEERAALLAEACGDDVELRAEVESLLEHDSRAGDDFLRPPEPPPGVRLSDVPDGPDPLIGERIGSFRVKAVIAAGGMGTVYEAKQDQPRRIVALKVMNRCVASRSALRRFQFESQILAHLRHPNIAQVYEAGMHGGLEKGIGSEPGEADVEKESFQRGACPLFQPQPTTTGVPYFAMEYIPEARSITRYADENSLDTRDRLRLFAKVCDAVHHGHQKGIIHRDLKPGNILVDAAGEPKVIDFGVARATDSDIAVTTMRTDVGQLIGTLQYMSPEQCDADPHEIDTRSDVYSLGVVLYELLTGELPYEATGSTIVQAAQIIKTQAPEKLSAIDRKLRGDVETIVLKALEKDREKRYGSVAELAQDIHRHLNREPIEARPPTTWTRAVRWAGRHPMLTTAGACFIVGVLTVLSTTVTSLWYLEFRPYELVLRKEPGSESYTAGYEAQLVSRNQRVLWTWEGERPFGIELAALADRPETLGGGRLAIIAYGLALDNPEPGALCAYDVDGDLAVPVWRKRIETEDILPVLREKRGFVAEEFASQDGWIHDVFPEHPGDEIVAVFAAGVHSQRILRIYDLTGALLYQIWHDGSMAKCYWMSDAGLLVFGGDCHRPYHDDYGKLLGTWVKVPVVFALRPEVGFIGDDWLPLRAGRDPLSPVWYLRIWPDSAADVTAGIRLGSPHPPSDPGRRMRFDLYAVSTAKGNVWWVVNEHGEEVAGSRGVGDAYKSNQMLPDDDPDKLPDPSIFYLAPMELAEP